MLYIYIYVCVCVCVCVKGVVRIFSWGGARFPEDFLGGGEAPNLFRANKSIARSAKKIIARSAKNFWGSPPLNQLRPPLKIAQIERQFLSIPLHNSFRPKICFAPSLRFVFSSKTRKQ